MKTEKKSWKTELRDYTLIVMGCLIYCISWTMIFVPNEIVSGGVTGLCTVIQYGTGFPLAISYPIVNIFLIILAFFLIGRSFGFKTILALVLISLFLNIMPLLHLPPLSLKENILNPILASMIEAVGVAMVIMSGGSTGGTDIIAMIINKYTPISLGRVYIMFDVLIIASVLLIPGKTVDDVVYGYIAVMVFSFGLDYLLLGSKSTVQLMVFSDKNNEIADYINKVMERGVTALNAIGWYSQKERKVLLIYMRRREISEITAKIKELDPRAFVAVTTVKGVYGEGFEEIKVTPKLKIKK